MNCVAQGQRAGYRRVGVPDRFTSTAARATSRVRRGVVGGRRRVGERGGPVADVVGEHCAGEPCAVRAVVPGGDVLKAGAFFEVADGELDNGVGAVEPVSGGGVVFGVGD